ncbi:hypothetical protein, partial [Microcoleus sp. Pol12A5]|uniref:hypothetical protein n=1 Tax=Microcoleus sp. Pol12A5 TaxID=3055392 RepID=UPI002FD26F79
QVTVVFPTPPLKLITAIDLGLMAGFVWILLKYKLKHIVAVSRSRAPTLGSLGANFYIKRKV